MLLGVVTCGVCEHDLTLVALAAVLCAFACRNAVHMLSRTGDAGERMRPVWVAAAALAFGTGIWSTHFVAMLAFRTGAPVSFVADITLASLALAICCSFVGFVLLIGTRSAPLGAAGAGVLLVGGVGGMHYIGVTAMVSPELLHFAPSGVAASLAAGLLFSVAGLLMFRRGHLSVAAALLCLAVCSLHFTSMASARIEPMAVNPGPALLSPGLFALALAAAGLLVLALNLTSSLQDSCLSVLGTKETSREREFANATFDGMRFETDGVIAETVLPKPLPPSIGAVMAWPC